ncbi:MAG: hypothetical protein NDJ90_16220, partial [Oligoflexia bacterium]|nr:hypothetical protein [Oligoflexia bacterium]
MTNAKTLHEKALELAKTYLSAEASLIDIIQQIDQARVYRELGFRSVFEYVTEALGLSEHAAYNLITVARKALEVPLLKEKIAAQEICLSKARTISPVLTPENQEKWISAAQHLSKRQLEKEVARERPEILTPERTRYVEADRIKLEMGLSEDLHEALRRVQDLVSSRMKKAASLEETLEVLVETFLDSEDPLKKAEKSKERKKSLVPGRVNTGSGDRRPRERKALPATLKRGVLLRDQSRCTYTDARGRRCGERRWLDHHHKTPISHGGENSLENL